MRYLPKGQILRISAYIVVLFEGAVAENSEYGVVLPENDRIPDGRRHDEGEIAPIERERLLMPPIVVDDIDRAMDTQHKLRAATVCMLAAPCSLGSSYREHPRNREWHLRGSFRHHDLAALSCVERQVDQPHVADCVQCGHRSRAMAGCDMARTK